MQFLIETLKNASLHVHAVWLAIAVLILVMVINHPVIESNIITPFFS